MATPMQPPSKPTKVVCKECKRTTIVVTIAGERITVDPEIIAVVPYAGGPAIAARRKHGELCPQYKRAEELRAMKMKKR